MKWLTLAQSLLPIVLNFIPGLSPLLIPVIVQGIQEAEQIKGSGAEKKQHVIALVHLAIETINTAKKKTVIDPKAVAVADRAIDTAVAIVNLVAKH